VDCISNDKQRRAPPGGRELIKVVATPAACKATMASRLALGRVLSSRTEIPSMSDTSRRIGSADSEEFMFQADRVAAQPL
jgi:hypothetical protein